MKKLIAAALVTGSLGACSNTALDYADSASTAVAVSQGFTELNPVIGVAGDAAAPVVALVVKAGIREYMTQQGFSECEVNRTVNASSVLGLGNNLAVLAGAGPVGLAIGAMAAIAYYESQDCAVVYNTLIEHPVTGELVAYYDVIIDPETGEREYVE